MLGSQRMDCGGRDHGAPPPPARRRRSPVSSGEHPDDARQEVGCELVSAGCAPGAYGMSADFADLLPRLLTGQPASPRDMRAAFDAILAGTWTPVQVGAFAIALRIRGESAEEIVAAAQATRAAMVVVEHELPVVVDTCGTGGDGSHTLNLSSGAAVVIAACGLMVAKHGNRSMSSR